MSKSLLGMHREMEKQQPYFKMMRKLENFYAQHPSIYEKKPLLDELHKRIERAQRVQEAEQAQSLKPLHDALYSARQALKAAVDSNVNDRRSLMLGYCEVEWDVLNDRITALPEVINPIENRPNVFVRFGLWILSLLPQPKLGVRRE